MNTINNSFPNNTANPPRPQSPAREAFAQQMARALGSNQAATPEQNTMVREKQNLNTISKPSVQTDTSLEAPRLGMVLDIKV